MSAYASSSRLTLHGIVRRLPVLCPTASSTRTQCTRNVAGRPNRGCRAFSISSVSSEDKKKKPIRYNYNTSISFSEEPDPETLQYRRLTANDLLRRKEPPTKVQMLVRDFIDDSLYNPNYGYFSKNAIIFSPPDEGYDFTKFRNTADFQEAIAARYESEYGQSANEVGPGRQVWHTPTELFKPYFAQALTNAIISNHRLNNHPDHPLHIYELGAGNGSFMVDCLEHIRNTAPDIFENMKYTIIEISEALAAGQRTRAKARGLDSHVEIIREDFFTWNGGNTGPCYVVALEVLDNFAHDMVRYDLQTLQPFQAVVTIDSQSDFQIIYEPLTDPLLLRIIETYHPLLPSSPSTSPPIPSAILKSPSLRNLYNSLPFAPNLSKPDFIPSKAVLFLERLRQNLPGHRFLVADFSELPDAVKGRNGPVVQTRVGGMMIPCETFLVKQGYFDIFFPTDFGLLRDVYSLIMNSPAPPPATTLEHAPQPVIPPAITLQRRPPPPPSSQQRTPIPPSQSRPHNTKNPQTGNTPPHSSSSTPSTSTPSFTSSTTSVPLQPPFQTSPKLPNPTTAHPTPSDFFTPPIRGFRRRQIGIYEQGEFINKFGGKEMMDKLRTRDGGNLVEGMYKNARIMF